jgi:hypothetical protein
MTRMEWNRRVIVAERVVALWEKKLQFFYFCLFFLRKPSSLLIRVGFIKTSWIHLTLIAFYICITYVPYLNKLRFQSLAVVRRECLLFLT